MPAVEHARPTTPATHPSHNRHSRPHAVAPPAMSDFRRVVLLSIPGLREQDLAAMPHLAGLAGGGAVRPLRPVFPAVTCPAQVSLTTGVAPDGHGVVANGFYHRPTEEKPAGGVEMWTAWNDAVPVPQIWDRLKAADASLTSAVWFPMLAKGAGADYVCTPAPIHNPDGSESLWCYTKPTELYGELRDALGHFPLMKFWGPLSSIESSRWIVDSAVHAAEKFEPRFWYVYLPHLDYAAQKFGPDSGEATAALAALDEAIGVLVAGLRNAPGAEPLWLAASEYVITPVDTPLYPNRTLRDAGLLTVDRRDDGEHLVPGDTPAWALVDHQVAHVYVRDAADVERTAALFRPNGGIERVLTGSDRAEVGLDHPHAGEVVLVAGPGAWFAYYWWTDDAAAPPFARTVDIHRKPGYDPVEMFLKPGTRETPLDATLIRGSHGRVAGPETLGVLLSSDASVLPDSPSHTDVPGVVLRAFGVNVPA